MIFWYEVITSKDIDIDFDRIYTFVSEELENSGKNNDLEDIYNEFVDNVCYYVRSVVGDCEDLEEDDNDCFIEMVISYWEEYLNNKHNFTIFKYGNV